jgi:hypothetical protein
VLKFDACLLFWCSAGRSADLGARPSVTLSDPCNLTPCTACSILYFLLLLASYTALLVSLLCLNLRPTLPIVIMASKRGSADPSAPRKRVKATPRGTQSQPVVIEDSQQSQRLSPRRALIKSRLSNNTFESQLRSAAPEAAIVAPDEDASEAAIVEDGAEDSGFDAHLEDNFDDIEWSRLPGYIKPLALSRARRSWVYRYGWHVTLLKDPDRIFFVCRYCHKHRLKGGVYEATRSPTSAARHLEERKHGHGH